MKALKLMLMAVVLGAFSVGITACPSKSKVEEATETVQEAGDDAMDSAEDAVEDAGDAVEDAAE